MMNENEQFIQAWQTMVRGDIEGIMQLFSRDDIDRIGKAIDKGKERGYKIGFEKGHKDSCKIGNSEGYKIGFKKGYAEGFNTGRSEGFAKGFKDGSDSTLWRIKYDWKEELKRQKKLKESIIKKRRKNANNPTKTYLIKNKKGQYKIGKSKNPKAREKTLLSDDPDMKIVHIWNKNIESKLHQKFKSQRIRGEWFNLTNVQVEYICASA